MLEKNKNSFNKNKSFKKQSFKPQRDFKPFRKNYDEKDGKFLLLAKTMQGLEEVLADELRELNAENIEIKKRAVSYTADKKLMYVSNLYLRTALRILKPICLFKAKDENQFYNEVKKIDWPKYFTVNDTFALDTTVYSKVFTHSKYVALKAKDAIADQFRDKYKKRPNVDVENPSVRINIHIANDECTISLDTSGDSLHKRGYRLEKGIAPLNEVLAAGLILLSGWDKKSDFVDPMCGSGTLPIEAALIATNTPPGYFNKNFGFTNWKNFDESLWKEVLEEAKTKLKSCKANIYGSELLADNILKARMNAKRVKVFEDIKFSIKDINKLTPFENGGTAIINPPYGERLAIEEIGAFYKEIGDSLKKNFSDFDVWIISSNKEALKHVGLRASRRFTLFNGPLESKYHKFEMYKGSRKKKYQSEELKDE